MRYKRSSKDATESYPRVLGDLIRSEIKALTKILHLNSTVKPQNSAKAQNLIHDLPKRLRCKRLSLSGLGIKATGLCDLHKPINSDVLQDILKLVQREVTICFRPFDHYPEHVHSPEADILAKLRGLNGMWTKPSTSNITAQYGAWEYQIDGCAGCMLSRIAADENAISNLRAAIISRTRTGKRHMPRRLMPFVDECIRRYDTDKAEAIFSLASNYAYGLKETRKACSRASNAVHGGLRGRHKDKKQAAHGPSGLATRKKDIPGGKGTALPPNSDIEWAVPSFPRTSGSHYSREIDNLGNTRSKYMASNKLTEFCRDNAAIDPQYTTAASCNTSEESKLVTDIISQIDDAIEESSMYRLIYQCSSSESYYDTED